MTSKKPASKNAIADLVKSINKKYGDGTLLPASEAVSLVLDRISTGILDLDLKLGGGIPRGRITMLKGDWSTGKSAVCLKVAAEAQRTCRFCNTPFEKISFLGEVTSMDCKCGANEPMRVVWLDAEHSFAPDWAEKWGITTDDILIIETEYAEQAIDVADACIRSKECDLLVVDSVAALAPGVEITESSEKWQMGVMARLMNKALRKWTSGLNSYGLLDTMKCTILMVNQLRVGIGGFRPTTTSPGGRGLDFFESIDVKFKRASYINEENSERPIGINVEFAIKKNKTAPPAQPGGMFSLYFVPSPGRYAVGSTDLDAQTVRLGLYWGILQKKGSWIVFPDDSKYQGKEAATQAIRVNEKLLYECIAKIQEKELSWTTTGVGFNQEKEDSTDE